MKQKIQFIPLSLTQWMSKRTLTTLSPMTIPNVGEKVFFENPKAVFVVRERSFSFDDSGNEMTWSIILTGEFL